MAKRPFNYIRAMQEIKGKVNFNYRNQRNETLSAGRKAAIRRAWNDLQELKTTTIVKPKKKKGESKRGYQKRIRKLKKEYGQTGNALNGVAVSVPPGGKAVINKKGKVEIRKKKSQYRETIIPVDPLELAENTDGLIRSIVFEHQPDALTPFHTHWRGKQGFMLFYDDSDELEEQLENIVETVSGILNQYKGNPHVMTGFLLQYNLE